MRARAVAAQLRTEPNSLGPTGFCSKRRSPRSSGEVVLPISARCGGHIAVARRHRRLSSGTSTARNVVPAAPYGRFRAAFSTSLWLLRPAGEEETQLSN